MQTLDSSEDTDLELMFAEIRRYPLLTADEEKDIDKLKAFREYQQGMGWSQRLVHRSS